jgi:hypothetical protein
MVFHQEPARQPGELRPGGSEPMDQRSAVVAATLVQNGAGAGDGSRIGAQLRAARLAHRMTLAEVALRSGMTK